MPLHGVFRVIWLYNLQEQLDDDGNLLHQPPSSHHVAKRRRQERERATREHITFPLARRYNGVQRHVTDHADGTNPSTLQHPAPAPIYSQRQLDQHRRQEREQVTRHDRMLS